PTRAPRHTGGETEGPAATAPRSESRGLVRASSSLREAPPHAEWAADVAAHQPGLAAIAGPPANRGGDLPPVRPPVSHRDGPDEAGPAAGSGRPLQGTGADLQKAPVLRLGEGPDLPGRSPARLDLQ